MIQKKENASPLCMGVVLVTKIIFIVLKLANDLVWELKTKRNFQAEKRIQVLFATYPTYQVHAKVRLGGSTMIQIRIPVCLSAMVDVEAMKTDLLEKKIV